MDQTRDSIVSFRDVYINDSRGETLFKRLNFELYEGERVFILGHTDRERSLILYTILGMLEPLKGEVKALKRIINRLDPMELLEYRRYTGYVYAQEGLIREISLEENIELPLIYNNDFTEEKIEERLEHLYNLFELDREQMESSWNVNNIVKKKVLLARAVINHPRLLLIDEPSTYIEKKDIAIIKELIDEVINDEFLLPESTVIITSEDKRWAKRGGDKIIYLQDGQIRYCGPAEDF